MNSLQVQRATSSYILYPGARATLGAPTVIRNKKKRDGERKYQKINNELYFFVFCAWLMAGRKLEVYVACSREGKGGKRGGYMSMDS